MKLIVIDTETSDLDPAKGAELLEVAWVEVTQETGVWKPSFHTCMRVCYDGPISPHARATHHIDPKKLTLQYGAHPKENVIQFLLSRLEPNTIMVAHVADFDSKFLPLISGPWICTYKTSKHVWPNAPGHGNQVLRYWLGVDIFEICSDIKNLHPHQALYDVATTTGILLKMLEHRTPEQLIQLTRTPIKLQKIQFGKHKGTPFDQIPLDYLAWLRRQSELDDDLKHTLDMYLNK